MKRSDKMSTVGIVAEFNPLHTGHEYLIKEAKKLGNVVCVISSNFVQRGDTAIYDKRIRAKSALLCGCDICIELPVLWSMSTAQNFALGAVSNLINMGCDTIAFGSECGDIDELTALSCIIESDEFKNHLSSELKKGITFAKARENAVRLCGGNYKLLSGANNNLAIEYIAVAKKIKPDISFFTVKRIGAEHDSKNEDAFVCASFIREKIKENLLSETKNYIPDIIYELFEKSPYSDINRLENAILAVLRTRSKEDLKNLPDVSEGIENRLYSAIKVSSDMVSLYNELKVKRYTLARIRRLVISAFLGLGNSLFMKSPPYIRILGFNKTGEQILKNSSNTSTVPVITKVSDIDSLSQEAKLVFETECRATDLYNLSLNVPSKSGTEFTEKIIKMEC
ncbi:MAG: nucleotidyltransferase family protein [Clostridia bacterium]|nr:nucleotidyltransferase family protein [Clostridia bacterium]